MQLTVLKENLQKGLAIVEKGVSVRPQLPILSHILLEAEKNHFRLSATNLEIGINHTVGAKIEKEGKICIPGRLLVEFVNSLTADKIELKLEDNKLLVLSKKTQAQFATSNPSDFPSFPSISETKNSFPHPARW